MISPKLCISPSKACKSQLLGIFIDDFSNLQIDPSGPLPWLRELPYQSCPVAMEELCLNASSAASLAFMGAITANEDVKELARKSYATGLESQRKQIAVFHSNARKGSLSEYALMTTALLLCAYEVLQPSALFSWHSHAQGAAQIMKVLGPSAFRKDQGSNGWPYQLYSVLRFGAVSRNPFKALSRLLTHTVGTRNGHGKRNLSGQ